MTPRWRKTKTKKRAKREGKIFGIGNWYNNKDCAPATILAREATLNNNRKWTSLKISTLIKSETWRKMCK